MSCTASLSTLLTTVQNKNQNKSMCAYTEVGFLQTLLFTVVRVIARIVFLCVCER